MSRDSRTQTIFADPTEASNSKEIKALRFDEPPPKSMPNQRIWTGD